MTEFRPEMCGEAAQQNLLQWLLKKLKPKVPFDANKLYCSEILAILLQDTQGKLDFFRLASRSVGLKKNCVNLAGASSDGPQ